MPELPHIAQSTLIKQNFRKDYNQMLNSGTGPALPLLKFDSKSDFKKQ
jgi:hypothetical protein